jgi:hypothetical protein
MVVYLNRLLVTLAQTVDLHYLTHLSIDRGSAQKRMWHPHEHINVIAFLSWSFTASSTAFSRLPTTTDRQIRIPQS